MINISSFVRFHALRTPDRPALVYDGARISYADFMARIEAAAAWLSGQGVAAGDVVAVLMKNSAAFLDIAFATSHIGAVFLPINFRLSPEEVEYIVGHADAKLVIVDSDLASNVPSSPPAHPVDSTAQADIRRLVGNARGCAAVCREPSDLFRLMYTSGTTDRPKGVMHSYENFYWKCSAHVAALGLGIDTKLLIVGPLYHVGAFDLPGVAVLWQGGTIVLHRDFDPVAILSSIASEKVNGAWLAPVMTSAILSSPARERFDVSSLRWVIGGGERTPEGRIRSFAGYFASCRYIDSYGLTESCGGDTFMEPGREIEKIGSTGRAVPHVEITIRDEAGEAVPDGESGEVCLRGPKVTKGYWRDPDKTAASFFGDWFRTGDVGYLDSESFLFLTDRKKDMIISGGENIASSEVERVLYEHAAVHEAAVIGVPDERWGERPVAFVVLAQGAAFDLAAMQDHCRRHLAAFKVPRQLFVRAALPRNASGKILKRQLREEVIGSEV